MEVGVGSQSDEKNPTENENEILRKDIHRKNSNVGGWLLSRLETDIEFRSSNHCKTKNEFKHVPSFQHETCK